MPAMAGPLYIRRILHTVMGFLALTDAHVIQQILDDQRRREVRGNLCEVGVHHGRLFLLLALARQEGESALGIDLFEDDEGNRAGRHAGRDAALPGNAKRLGIPLAPSEIWKISSLEVTAEALLARAGGPLRFISIDGGHAYGHVHNDLNLARQCMTPNGVIALDDFCSQQFPEVTAAALDFLRTQEEYIPALCTPCKLYLTRRESAQALVEAVTAGLSGGFRIESYRGNFFGNDLTMVRPTMATQFKERVKNRRYE
jgi:hypothetical protein